MQHLYLVLFLGVCLNPFFKKKTINMIIFMFKIALKLTSVDGFMRVEKC